MRVCPTPGAGPPRRWPLASPIIAGPSRNCCRFMCHRRAGHLPNNVGVPHMRSSALLSGGAGTTVSCGATPTQWGNTMGFFEVLTQVIELLQREGRVSYRALKREFSLEE